MAAYKEIENYVKENYKFVPKTCWIADVKKQCGLTVRPAWNRKSLGKRKVPCPKDKIQPIKEALRYFKMVS
jgi:hypothetical protein